MAGAYSPPTMDFSSLANLPEAYWKGQEQGRERKLREALAGGLPRTSDGQIDYAAAADLAARSGDLGMARTMAAAGEASADKSFDRTYKKGMLGVAQAGVARREEPEDIRKLRAAGIDPRSPAGLKALFPRTDTPISSTDKKAIFAAEDEIPQTQGTIENLSRALELNDKTFQGVGAGTRATLGANLPDWAVPDYIADPKTSIVTQEWQKIMGPEALSQMAGTLKGATTDFELRKFIEMLGDPATNPSVRKSVIERMKRLAERKLELQQARMKDLRGGTYFGASRSAPTGQTGGGDPLSQAREAIARGAPRDAVIQRLQQNGIDPAGL